MNDVVELGFDNVNRRFDDMEKHIDDKFSDNAKQHDEMIVHQKHTNGDVKKLKLWQAGIIGGFSVVVVFMGILAFVLKEQIAFFLHPEIKVKEAVEEALKNSDIKVELYDYD